jgi:succinate dehydrogenase / fumarate reductase, cytochrome b subunit
MPGTFLGSQVGKKVVVALTGLILYGFVVGHMIGNLQVFGGRSMMNDYAEFLRNTHGMLWVARFVLLASVTFHILYTVQLTRANRLSRPVKYVEHKAVKATLASRIMIWSGVFLGLYIPYHILHLTLGTAHPQFNPQDVYANVVTGFQSVPTSAIYILAMVSLGLHLQHGVFSLFQTLGFNHPKYNGYRRALAVGSAFFVSAGYIAVPVAVLLGLVRVP